jgi:hypothetical protein
VHRLLLFCVLLCSLTVTAFSAPPNTVDRPERSRDHLLLRIAESAVLASNDALTSPTDLPPPVAVATDPSVSTKLLALPTARRAAMRAHGLRYASYVTSFSDESVTATGETATVLLTESTSLVNAYVNGATADLPITEYARQHVLSLQRANGRWTVAADEEVEAFSPSTADDMPDLTLPTIIPNDEVVTQDRSAAAMGIPHALSATHLDRSKIVNYALRWVGTDLHVFSTRGYNPTYAAATFFNDDCTDFISQALYDGGWTFKPGLKWFHDYWWFEFVWPRLYTDTWTIAKSWSEFAQRSGRAWLTGSVRDLQLGDILQFGTENDGRITHSMIVTSRDSAGNIWLTYHSVNEKNRSFWDLDTAQKKIYPRITYYRWRLQDWFN